MRPIFGISFQIGKVRGLIQTIFGSGDMRTLFKLRNLLLLSSLVAYGYTAQAGQIDFYHQKSGGNCYLAYSVSMFPVANQALSGSDISMAKGSGEEQITHTWRFVDGTTANSVYGDLQSGKTVKVSDKTDCQTDTDILAQNGAIRSTAVPAGTALDVSASSVVYFSDSDPFPMLISVQSNITPAQKAGWGDVPTVQFNIFNTRLEVYTGAWQDVSLVGAIDSSIVGPQETSIAIADLATSKLVYRVKPTGSATFDETYILEIGPYCSTNASDPTKVVNTSDGKSCNLLSGN
jgi:hypothetical protein